MFTSVRSIGLFISTGSQTKMYTLREMVKGYVTIKGIRYDKHQAVYLKNLSTDLEVAKRELNRLSGLRGLPVLDTGEAEKLNPITRDATGERQAREEQKRLDIERREEEEAQLLNDQIILSMVDVDLSAGFVDGKYGDDKRSTQEIVDADPSYAHFMFDNVPPLSQTDGLYSSRLQYQIEQLRTNGMVTLPPILESFHVGEVGEKLINVVVTCDRKSGFETDYGWTSRYTVRDEKGCIYLVDYTGHKWDMEESHKYVMTGKIKSHDQFRGVLQTKMTRCSIVDFSNMEEIGTSDNKVESKSTGGQSKMDRARKIFVDNRLHESRKSIIGRFMADLEMGTAGASTYYQKCKKEETDNVL